VFAGASNRLYVRGRLSSQRMEPGRDSQLTEKCGQFKAIKKFSKGESIYTQDAAFGVEVNRLGESRACAHCLRILPGTGATRDHTSIRRIRCPFGSRCCDVFCSDLCVERATGKREKNGWHLLCCTGEKLNSGNYAFEQFCAATSDTIRLTAIIIARTIDPNSQYSIHDLLRECHTCFPWHAVAARCLVNNNDIQFSDFAQAYNNLAENFAQAWQLLSSAWLQNENELVRALMHVLNIDVFSQLAAAFELLFRPALTSCCFKDDTREVRVTNLARISRLFRPGLPCDNTDMQSTALCFFPEQEDSGHKSTQKLSSTCQFFVFSPLFAQLSHSCSPNAQLEVEETPNGTSVKLIALQNISNLDDITVCFVPLSDSLSSRRRKIFSQFGFWCQCPRCNWESNLRRAWLGLKASRSLCLQYLEEERFHQAEELARFTMTQVDCPDISHILGQALLGEGKWHDAHKVWHDASSQFPCHVSLAELVKKDYAYSEHIFMCSTPPLSIHPIPLSGTDIWTSSTAVLSAETCGYWIKYAENFASDSSGWSERRHHTVPTTDLPLHVIPEILEGWRILMRSTIRPFLALIAPGVEQNQIKVHDAFIVKYSAAQGQRFLPVHSDEGQWSLTLALNDLNEYDGGGTLFDSEKIIIRPDIGELVMFRSSTLHAGAPVTRGTRYIIAAFLFITDE